MFPKLFPILLIMAVLIVISCLPDQFGLFGLGFCAGVLVALVAREYSR